MAKPLGPKSLLIRQAIAAHPDRGNTEIAETLMDSSDRMDDKLKITAQDVATQRQAMKKPGAQASPATSAEPAASEPARARPGNGRRKPGRKPGRKTRPRPQTQAAAAQAAPVTRPAQAAPRADLVSHVEAIREAVRGLGADQVKRIVDLFE